MSADADSRSHVGRGGDAGAISSYRRTPIRRVWSAYRQPLAGASPPYRWSPGRRPIGHAIFAGSESGDTAWATRQPLAGLETSGTKSRRRRGHTTPASHPAWLTICCPRRRTLWRDALRREFIRWPHDTREQMCRSGDQRYDDRLVRAPFHISFHAAHHRRPHFTQYLGEGGAFGRRAHRHTDTAVERGRAGHADENAAFGQPGQQRLRAGG